MLARGAECGRPWAPFGFHWDTLGAALGTIWVASGQPRRTWGRDSGPIGLLVSRRLEKSTARTTRKGRTPQDIRVLVETGNLCLDCTGMSGLGFRPLVCDPFHAKPPNPHVSAVAGDSVGTHFLKLLCFMARLRCGGLMFDRYGHHEGRQGCDM